jgi:hypothetical protein
MNEKFSKSLILVVLGILLLTMIPYFLTFNGLNFSKVSDDWGAFGSYISGILSVINLFIFIFLTFYLSKIDKTRTDNDRILQKKIVITQFRQNELNQIDKSLDNIFANGTEEKPIIIKRITDASLLLTNFLNQKEYLFTILNSEKVKILSENLLDKLSQFLDIIEETYGQQLDNELQKKYETKLQAYIFLKNEFVENLQHFVLTELD